MEETWRRLNSRIPRCSSSPLLSLTYFAMENETSKTILLVPRRRTSPLSFYFFLALSISILVTQLRTVHIPFLYRRVPPHISLAISRCQHLQLKTGPPPGFYRRTRSDRYVEGTKPVLLRRARIWTGEKNGTEVIRGDILLDMGLIKAVGHVARHELKAFNDDLIIIDAKNAWVTPGIVDVHSHIGNSAAPELVGASEDYDSALGIIQVNQQCWLRPTLKVAFTETRFIALVEKPRWIEYS